MYIYHALINALSTHMIHISLHMIFYTHVAHSPTKTIYVHKVLYKKKRKKALHTHNDCSRNWVLILVRMEILGEEEGFQYTHVSNNSYLVTRFQYPADIPSRSPEREQIFKPILTLVRITEITNNKDTLVKTH